MRPWIWPGGMLGIQQCTVAELSVGDIAVWFDGRNLKSHRVIAVDATARFVTRADLGARDDTPAGDPELLGRAVSFSIRGVGYRLDRGLPSVAGRALARAPWLGAVASRAYRGARRILERFQGRRRQQ